MSKYLILGASEAEKFNVAKWPKYCETPCILVVVIVVDDDDNTDN